MPVVEAGLSLTAADKPCGCSRNSWFIDRHPPPPGIFCHLWKCGIDAAHRLSRLITKRHARGWLFSLASSYIISAALIVQLRRHNFNGNNLVARNRVFPTAVLISVVSYQNSHELSPGRFPRNTNCHLAIIRCRAREVAIILADMPSMIAMMMYRI